MAAEAKDKRFVVDVSGMTEKEKKMASYDEETPSSFRKEVMFECEGISRAEKITLRRNASIHAMDMSGLQDDGFEAKQWRKLYWELKSNRI